MTDAARADLSFILHALASEFDERAGVDARDVLLRAAGRRMAERLRPPSSCGTLQALEIEINDLLSRLRWGRAEFQLQSSEQALRIVHRGLPRVGALGDPPGSWLSAVLEGLYEVWIATQPEATGRYVARRQHADRAADDDSVVLVVRAETGHPSSG